MRLDRLFVGIALTAAPGLRRVGTPVLGGSVSSCAAWLEDVYGKIDYEKILFSDGACEDEQHEEEFGGDSFIYGESDLGFFLTTVRMALDMTESATNTHGFVDLGGGKGQLALAAARVEPERLPGPCVSLELMPELHRMAAAAYDVACTENPRTFGRLVAVQGSFYDAATLSDACNEAAVIFAYATKFESDDGVHIKRLSAALAACDALRSDAVIITVNRRLRASDGWAEVASAIEGEAPHEDSGRGTAYFWRRATAADDEA